MSAEFALPDLGEGLQEAEIVEWHVAEGEHVVADQPLVSVETEKAVVEIPSPHAGRIARLLAKRGDRLKVGAPLVAFEEGTHPDAGTVVGTLASPPERAAPSAPSRPSSPSTRVKATPAVRALAAERQVDLTRLSGTGPDGAITRDDVLAAAGATTPSVGEALRGVRLSMARNMTLAHQAVVPATVFDDADVGVWFSREADVMLRLIRAIVKAAAAEPALNAWFDGARMTRAMKPRVDLGIAVDTAAGLIVPVLRDAGGQDAAALRPALDALIAATEARTIAPAALKDATITLSNFGALGGRYACLVVVPPQVAIIGAGRIAARAGSRPSLPLSLTFDHRVVTGGEAARFLKALLDDLERPN